MPADTAQTLRRSAIAAAGYWLARLVHTSLAMAIVCFLNSTGGSHVAVVAALLAHRMKASCHLAQSTEETRDSAAHRARAAWLSARLAGRAERLRGLTRDVHSHVLPGPAERHVAALAERVGAEMVVTSVASTEHRVDALAQHLRVPVLGVRDEVPFVRWGAEIEPLRMLAAVMGAADLPVVLRMVKRLTEAGPCEVHLLHIQNEAARSAEGFREQLPLAGLDARWHVHSEPPRGARADQILAFAEAHEAHVIILGSRVMARVSRLWERSVSRRVLQQARCAVLCVPVGAAPGRRPLHSVMAATDFSSAGDAALALAARVTAPGGVVHVVHVSRTGVDAEAGAHARLDAAAQALGSRDLSWKTHIFHGDDLGATLARAVKELAVDALCVGGHGRPDGVAESRTAALMSQVGCALLIARPADS